MDDPNGLTLYVSTPLYEYYSRNGIPSPFTYLVENRHLPLLGEDEEMTKQQKYVMTGKMKDGSTAPSGGVIKTDSKGHAIKRTDAKKKG